MNSLWYRSHSSRCLGGRLLIETAAHSSLLAERFFGKGGPLATAVAALPRLRNGTLKAFRDQKGGAVLPNWEHRWSIR